MQDQTSFIAMDSSPGAGIAVYENVWENAEEYIKNINYVTNDKSSGIKYGPSTVLSDSYSEKRVDDQHRNSNDISITYNSHNAHFLDIQSKCASIVDLYLNSYKKEFNIHDDIFSPEGFQLLKYEPGGYFKTHYDSYPAVKRCISVLIYLNDDYDGGEIEFVYFNAKIKPKAGSLILFPSNYPYRHIAHPVTNGTKYAIVTWLHER
jgi:Rps23 Pro-64 3,4-dihydroxylase Tpa1-like proline 4-hydroxylase